MRTRFTCIALVLFSAGATAGTLRDCETRTKTAFPDYEPTPGSVERGPATHDTSNPYSRSRGDYDGDGKADIAILLSSASAGKYAISVCLSSKPSGSPELIKDAYTAGPISTTPKGRKYHDFDTNTEHTYERDGIGSYCCECCGATYIYRSGQFVEVVDSD
jgi:hypothetical protein